MNKSKEERINEIIGDDIDSLLTALIKDDNLELRYNGDDTFALFDTDNGSKYSEGIEIPSDLIDCLPPCTIYNVFENLAADANDAGILTVPQISGEWSEWVMKSEYQEFIDEHRSEVAQALLIANPQRMDDYASLDNIADNFGKGRPVNHNIPE
jgi:hypothetical protein